MPPEVDTAQCVPSNSWYPHACWDGWGLQGMCEGGQASEVPPRVHCAWVPSSWAFTVAVLLKEGIRKVWAGGQQQNSLAVSEELQGSFWKLCPSTY